MLSHNPRLTRFLCQELLYEYERGTLGEARRRDVSDYVAQCRDSQRELENLRRGQMYCVAITGVRVSSSLHAALVEFEPAWKKRLRSWTLWSSQRGWRLLPYLFIFSSVGLGLYLTKPWNAPVHDYVLVESPNVEAPALSGPMPAVVDLQVLPKAPTPLATVGVIESADRVRDESPRAESIGTKVADGAKDKGAVWSAELVIGDLDNAAPRIREKVIEFDGVNAGNLDLGWRKTPHEAYFHFTLPESKREEMETFLKTFGPVQFTKRPHRRVMPEGQIRIILTVKDGDRNETEAEAP